MKDSIPGTGYWQQASPNVTLDSLFQNKEDLCFLAGSGISCDKPTDFPNGREFSEMLLKHMLPLEVKDDVLALMDHERENMQNPGDFLHFEGLLMHLQESIDPALQVLYGFDASVEPNLIHKFLARMIIYGSSVFTTNFDSLIEYALLYYGTSRDKIFPVIHDIDWQSEFEEKSSRVYKLHGSLFDVRWKTHCVESLQATLTQIAKNKSGLFQLEPWKQEMMRHYLCKFDLVVLGYSGLDDFDVLPTLLSIQSNRRILWISHDDSKRDIHEAQIEIFEDTPSKIMSKEHLAKKVDRISSNLFRFINYKSRLPSKLIRVNVHTGELINWLSKKYFSNDNLSYKYNHPENSKVADKFWFPTYFNIPDSQRWLLAGELLEERNKLDMSLEAYSSALVECSREGEKGKRSIGPIYNAMGRVFHQMGDYKSAEENYIGTLKIAENVGDSGLRSQALNNIGRLFSDHGNTEEAIVAYKQALSIAESEDNSQGISTILNNIGNCLYELGDLDEALVYYRKSLALATKLGNLKGVVAALNGVAMIFRYQSQLNESLDIYTQLLKTARLLGDTNAEKVILQNITSIFINDTSNAAAIVLL